MLRPFCRDEHDGHTCHLELGHPGPHTTRLNGHGLNDPVVRWYTAIQYDRPKAVGM